MQNSKQFSVSPEGLKKLEEELEYLKTVKRKEVAEAIKVARAFGDLSENSEYDEAKNEQAAIEQRIREKDADLAANKDKNLVGNMVSQGTTPRRLTDLIGSLCDLTSGSGDKGTPIILIQGYFDNLSKDY